MREIDAARKAAVPDLFAHLSQKFAWSIYVAPAADVPIPDELLQDLRQALEKLAAAGDAAAAQPRRNSRQSWGIEVRPPNPAAAVLARITGPEFPCGDLVAWLPPAWMVGNSSPESLTR
jgi:hypothetical protein